MGIIRAAASVAGGCMHGSFRPYQLGSFIPEIQAAIKDSANEKLRELRGVEIVSLAFDCFRLRDADTGMIKTIQLASVNQGTDL